MLKEKTAFMKVFLDNQLINKINTSKVNLENILPFMSDIEFGWPSFLVSLGLEALFEDFPPFNENHELFTLIISSLLQGAERDFIIRLYDQVFVECLTHIKALPQIHPAFLIHQIQERRHSQDTNHLFIQPLDYYENLLKENTSHTIHDLILYLAWDRVCVNLACVFEYPSPNIDIRKGLEVLKECLLESFQHITAHGRTKPSFFRLMEALYAYQMREENLQIHSECDWSILCKSACVLKPRNKLCDVFYIDEAIVDEQQIITLNETKEILTILTIDSADTVREGLSLATYMIKKLKTELPEWHYSLQTANVICYKELENRLIVDCLFEDIRPLA